MFLFQLIILKVAKIYVPHEIAWGDEVVSGCICESVYKHFTKHNFLISQNVYAVYVNAVVLLDFVWT